MPWGFVAGAAIGAVGSAVAAHSAQSAANTQAAAANKATDTQLQMFNTQNQQQAPYRQAGYTSLGALMQGLGLPGVSTDGTGSGLPGTPTSDVNSALPSGSLLKTFGPGDLPAYLAPNFDFSLKYGTGATTNMANAMGGLGGNSLAEIAKWTTGFAGDQYQRAYENYNTNQTNIFNRLASIAGIGQTAGSNSTTGASQFASGIAGSQMGAGNAAAAGQVGVGNAINSGLNNAMGWYSLNRFFPNSASSGVGSVAGADPGLGPG